MAQLKSKRALPAPIFNKGKRPRVTLVAHPNNLGGISHEAVQSKENYYNDRSFSSPFQEQNSFGRSSVLTSTQSKSSSHSQPRSTATTSYRQQRHWSHRDDSQESLMEPVGGHHNSYNAGACYGMNTPPGSSLSGTGRQAYQQLQPKMQQQLLHQQSYGPTLPPPPSASYGLCKKLSKEVWPTNHTHSQEDRVAVGASVAKAKEPSKSALVQVKKRPGVSDGVRVLTATAQGVRHWSQYKDHTMMLFEVYGTLASVAVSRQHSAEQEFSIRTTDGVLQCVFWEMEVKFPALERGRPVRVVGGWDPTHNRLKCYSVRPSQAGEDAAAVQQSVSVADRHMRRFVATMKQQ